MPRRIGAVHQGGDRRISVIGRRVRSFEDDALARQGVDVGGKAPLVAIHPQPIAPKGIYLNQQNEFTRLCRLGRRHERPRFWRGRD